MDEGAVAVLDLHLPTVRQIQLNLVTDGGEEGQDGPIVDVLFAATKQGHDATADESDITVSMSEQRDDFPLWGNQLETRDGVDWFSSDRNDRLARSHGC